MIRTVTILILLFGLSDFASSQVFPDSVKKIFVAQLASKDTLTIYVFRESCFYLGFEKFELIKQGNQYRLITFYPIPAYKLKLNRTESRSVLPDTLHFKAFSSYILADSNVIAFAQIEMLGEKCGIMQRGGGGAIGIFKMILNKKVKKFSNMCDPIKELEDIAIPEKYYTDLDEQEE